MTEALPIGEAPKDGQILIKDKAYCPPIQLLMIWQIGLKLLLDLAIVACIKAIELYQSLTKIKDFTSEVQPILELI
jgi:hypothetical protein